MYFKRCSAVLLFFFNYQHYITWFCVVITLCVLEWLYIYIYYNSSWISLCWLLSYSFIYLFVVYCNNNSIVILLFKLSLPLSDWIILFMFLTWFGINLDFAFNVSSTLMLCCYFINLIVQCLMFHIILSSFFKSNKYFIIFWKAVMIHINKNLFILGAFLFLKLIMYDILSKQLTSCDPLIQRRCVYYVIFCGFDYINKLVMTR